MFLKLKHFLKNGDFYRREKERQRNGRVFCVNSFTPFLCGKNKELT
jgi:hypothetical protein